MFIKRKSPESLQTLQWRLRMGRNTTAAYHQRVIAGVEFILT